MPLTPKQVATLQSLIVARHEVLAAEIRRDMAKSREESYGNVAGSARDPGDDAVADLIGDLDQAELARDLRELREVEAAMERLASGSYGICVDCGIEIDFDRLLAQPTALRCFDCQTIYEKTHAHDPEPKL